MSKPIRIRTVAALAAVALVGACSSGQTTTTPSSSAPAAGPSSADAAGSSAAPSSGGTTSGKITIALLQKQGDQQYFVDEAQGATDEAKKLGDVDVKVVDLGTDANKAISQVDLAISQKVNGIIIVVPDSQIGPQVIESAKKAGIPLVAANDAIKDAAGNEAPFVGFDGTKMGEEVGKKAGELYKAAGWTAADTKIISAWKQDLQTCTDRVTGAAEAFKAASGATEMPKIVEIGTDNSNTDAQNKAGAALTANQGTKHWVVWACNDEGETGVVTALQNAGVAPADIIGVGLGAYLTCKDWKAGQETGNKAALYISGHSVGATSVKVLVDQIRNGVALPAKTLAPTDMVDKTNWEAKGVVCT